MDNTERQNLERRLDDLETAIKAYPPLGELLASIYGLPETADARHDVEQILYAILGFLKDIPHPNASDLPIRRLFELMAALNDLDGPGKVGAILKQMEYPHGKGLTTQENMAHDLRTRAVQAKMKIEGGRERAGGVVASLQVKRHLTAKAVENQFRQQTRKGREPMVREISDTETRAAMKLADKLEPPKK